MLPPSVEGVACRNEPLEELGGAPVRGGGEGVAEGPQAVQHLGQPLGLGPVHRPPAPLRPAVPVVVVVVVVVVVMVVVLVIGGGGSAWCREEQARSRACLGVRVS